MPGLSGLESTDTMRVTSFDAHRSISRPARFVMYRYITQFPINTSALHLGVPSHCFMDGQSETATSWFRAKDAVLLVS